MKTFVFNLWGKPLKIKLPRTPTHSWEGRCPDAGVDNWRWHFTGRILLNEGAEAKWEPQHHTRSSIGRKARVRSRSIHLLVRRTWPLWVLWSWNPTQWDDAYPTLPLLPGGQKQTNATSKFCFTYIKGALATLKHFCLQCELQVIANFVLRRRLKT